MSEQKKSYDERRVGQVKLGATKSTGAEYLYMEFTQDYSFKKGDKVYLNDFVASLDKSVVDGKISKDRADELKAKMSFLIYNVDLPAKKA